MSVPESTPTVAEPQVEQPEVSKAPAAGSETETTNALPATENISPIPVKEETTGKGEALVEATPASEGVLGYKAPGLIKSLYYSKQYFWFSDEAVKGENLTSYIRDEKNSVAHPSAAWAQETGKGVLFHAKRVEDKSNPSGMILLHDVAKVTKEGNEHFSFKVGNHTYKFEAANTEERAAWIVAIEKNAEEAKGMKEDIHGRDSYKKTLEKYAGPVTIVGGAAAAAKKHESTETPAVTNTETPATNGLAKETDGAADEEAVKPEPATSKSRSQSRKRASIFGTLLNKKEDKDEAKKEEKTEPVVAEKTEAEKAAEAEEAEKKKADLAAAAAAREEKLKQEKAEREAKAKAEAEAKKAEKEKREAEKAEKKKVEKAEKEQKEKEKAEKKAAEKKLKEEKKAEAEAKKEEAKKEHDAQKAKEAAEAAAVAAVPAAAVGAAEKHEDKKEEKTAEEAKTPTDKKAKRTSVFGGLFAKKDVTSPTAEKTEGEAVPAVPAKDTEIPPVSETAPKIEEPIENKPIDTAAVVAPVDAAPTPVVEEPTKETAVEGATAPKTEEKSGFVGVLKSKFVPKKEEKKQEAAAETIAKDPLLAAAPTETATEATEPAAATESAGAATEERPARETRRSSMMGLYGTIKGRMSKSQEPKELSTEETEGEVKREKSPLPKIGGLFRRPSRAVKPAETSTPVTEETPATTETAVPESTESKTVGDVVPEESVHDAVTTAPSTEVKAAA